MPRLISLCLALTLASALCACAARQQQAVSEEQPAVSPQPSAAAREASVASTPQSDANAHPNADVQPTPAPAASSFSPPQASDIRAALERTYKGAVTFDEQNPRAIVGDFNGDGSEDLLVEARPAPNRLADLNDQLANWIVTDPRKVPVPDPRNFDPHQGVQKLAPASDRPRVEQADALLVVLHGYKEAGWRNPEALQTYILRNAAGTDLRRQSRAEAQVLARKRLRLAGDVVQEKLSGETGFLYWTGATYGWFH